MEKVTAEITFIKIALGSFVGNPNETDRQNDLLSELDSFDGTLRKQFKAYVRLSEPELKVLQVEVQKEKNLLQEEKNKLLGSSADESEIVIKKRKSMTQASVIFSSPDFKEFSDEYVKTMTQLDNHNLERERLRKVEQDYHRLVQTFKSYIDDGSKTIIRSMFEVVIRNYEDKLYSEAISLFCFYHNRAYNDGEDDLFAFNQEDINIINTIPAYASYKNYLDSLLFLQDLHARGLSRSEKLKEIRIHYSEHVTMPSSIPNLPSVSVVGENLIRSSLATIFSKLSDEIHQASSRFDGDSGNFILPRAKGQITIADTYAFAIIIKEAGLNPVYPNAQEEQSLAMKLFSENK